LWLEEENKGNVSFTSFLEALQYSSSEVSKTIDFFASELRKTSISIDGDAKELFIMPSALSLESIMDMPVTPENISKNIENPYILSDYIRELGIKLNVDLILIDLRAGLSELSSPIIFDPRIEHIFVTTIAKQSIVGISEILKRIHISHRKLEDNNREETKPTVIISMLTSMLRELPAYTEAIESINKSYPPFEKDNDDLVTQGIECLEFDFNEELMSISNIKQSISLLKKSSIYDTALLWSASLKETIESLPIVSDTASDKIELQSLLETCESFQFAENTSEEDMLVIDPIRNLAKNYSDTLPNVVSIGAKGAGKTFTYLQVSKAFTWNKFLKKVNSDIDSSLDAIIFPWISSTNLHESVRANVSANRKLCLESLEAKNISNLTDTVKKINEALINNDTNWDSFWIELLLEEFENSGLSLEILNKRLSENKKSFVILIDGIEDIFHSPEKEPNHNAAIRALLNLPNAISELHDRKIGFICFARADYVQSTIKQNVPQYISKYKQFRLEWTPDSFLRLAYWISAKSGIINANEKEAESSNLNFLLTNLERLWGKKLGRDNSKEANSARWVFAALCDLNGRLQARDLVRFLKFSADVMLKAPSNGIKVEFWADRVLAPEAIRRSLQLCSQEKVDEAEKEIKPLKQWIDELKSIKPELKKVPFNPLEVGLDLSLLTSLKELGVIYEDTDQPIEDRFYLPEIYRSGLQFTSSASGRPRVQALLKRNLGGIPF
ncbi:hypothetical protein, partial [Serratia sp. ASV30]|uniref:hypothetical protein n=1 Tax=Serratia sp. ASV30 TaxID=2795127 RepID=UPI0018ECDE84